MVLRGAHGGITVFSLGIAHLERGACWQRLVACDGERVVGVVKD